MDYLESHGNPYEVLVVDDGSSDNTADLAERFRQESPRAIPHSALRIMRNPTVARATLCAQVC